MRKRSLVIATSSIAILAICVLFVACLTDDVDLTEPISGNDYLYAEWLEEPVRAGNDLFGLAAPLENYIEVFLVGDSGGDTVESWLEPTDRAMYYLPLFDDNGQLVEVFIATRVSTNTFELAQSNMFELINDKGSIFHPATHDLKIIVLSSNEKWSDYGIFIAYKIDGIFYSELGEIVLSEAALENEYPYERDIIYASRLSRYRDYKLTEDFLVWFFQDGFEGAVGFGGNCVMRIFTSGYEFSLDDERVLRFCFTAIATVNENRVLSRDNIVDHVWTSIHLSQEDFDELVEAAELVVRSSAEQSVVFRSWNAVLYYDSNIVCSSQGGNFRPLLSKLRELSNNAFCDFFEF